jgi:class 3 adenylate cyclase
MLAAFNFINSKMSKEGLPSVGYRISSDYGRSDIARLHRSNAYDLFGSTVNICTEINRIATPNSMVIGDNLYQIINTFPSFLEDYLCKLAGEQAVGDLKQAYPVYSIASSRLFAAIQI